MPLKDGVDHELVAVRALEQRVGVLVWPRERQRRREGDEEVVKGVQEGVVVAHEAVAHLGEGDVVEPRSVGDCELRGTRRHPLWETVVVLLRGGDLPAHEEEHHVEDRDALGEGRDVGESSEYIGKDLGQRVAVDAVGWVEERRDGGVARADNVLDGEALGGTLTALAEKVEEEGVKRARRRAVLDGGRAVDEAGVAPGRGVPRGSRAHRGRTITRTMSTFRGMGGREGMLVLTLILLLLLLGLPRPPLRAPARGPAVQAALLRDASPVVLHRHVMILRRVLGAVDAVLNTTHPLRRVEEKVQAQALRTQLKSVSELMALLAQLAGGVRIAGGSASRVMMWRRLLLLLRVPVLGMTLAKWWLMTRRRGYAAGCRSSVCVCIVVVAVNAQGRLMMCRRGISLSGRYVGLLNGTCPAMLAIKPWLENHGRENKLALADERLQHGDYAGQAALDVGILLLDKLLGAEDGLEFLVGLLVCELLDAALERLDLILCALPDGTLSLSILRMSANNMSSRLVKQKDGESGTG